jgi:DNA polymerase
MSARPFTRGGTQLSEHGYQGEGSSIAELYQGLLDRQPYPEAPQRPAIKTPVDPGYPAGKTMLFHDWEWYCELDVRQYGTSRSSRHHSFDPLMCSYAFNDEAVKQWVPEEGEKMPSDLRDALRDPDVIKSCWNKPAEYCTWKGGFGIDIPHEQWRDTMVLALSLSLPGSLAKAGEVVGLPQDKKKDSRGKALIRIFSKPNVPTKRRPWERRNWITDPDEWEEFKAYNILDTEAERAIYRRLRKYDLPAHEWELWHIDQHINEAGLPINMDVVRNALRVNEEITSKRLDGDGRDHGPCEPQLGRAIAPLAAREQGYPYQRPEERPRHTRAEGR